MSLSKWYYQILWAKYILFIEMKRFWKISSSQKIWSMGEMTKNLFSRLIIELTPKKNVHNFWFLVGTLNGIKTTFSYSLFSLILKFSFAPLPPNSILLRSTGKHPKRTLEWKHFFVEISNFCFAKVLCESTR